MVAVTPSLVLLRQVASRALVAGLLLALPAGPLHAEGGRNAGLVIQVPTTLDTAATHRLGTSLHGPLKRFEAERAHDPKAAGTFKLVCDFNPEGRPSASEDFGACYELAKYLRSLKKGGVQTIGFVHGSVTRHSVLPLLACDEIVLSSDPPAHFGQVLAPGKSLTRSEQLAYEDEREVVARHRPTALIRKMYDPNVVLLKVPAARKDGDRYRDARERPRPAGELVAEPGEGATALYTFALAKEFGLCRPTACNSIEDVMAAYDLPRSSLRQPLDRTVAWRILATGNVTGELREQIERRVKQALAHKATLLIFQLECGSGQSQAAYEIGKYLAELNDGRREPVDTVAFVTSQARDTAAFLAFGCNRIIMQREVNKDGKVIEGARLGGFEEYLKEHPGLEAAIRENLKEIARKQHYPEILAEGMLSQKLRIRSAVSRQGSVRQLISEETFEAEPQRWENPVVVKQGDRYLTLSAEEARKLGVAQDLAAGFPEVCELEGVNPADVRLADSDWLDKLADFLRDPWTSVVLVMLGITCLILELKMPGVGLPGVVAAVCFVLFFWSHSQLNGQITWLAILLFVLGLLLIGLEVFVLPGFGVAGISGILLVLSSLGLVAYGHWPRSNEEWVGFGQKIGPFGISILGALAAAFFLARYLPSIPYANRLMLHPQDETDETGEPMPDTAASELAALLGAIGVAATPLRPAGKAQFGEEFVDVVAEGGYVVPGTRVQVIEIEGNRVVVKEV